MVGQMNPICSCGQKAKRGWAYCPHCAEHFDWETKAQKAARKKEHLRKMESDPQYRKKHEMMQRFTASVMEHRYRQFVGDVDPILKVKHETP